MNYRPHSILVAFKDPFDGALVASSHYHYDARLSQKGIYSRQVIRMKAALKSIQSCILEGRTPKISIKFLDRFGKEMNENQKAKTP